MTPRQWQAFASTLVLALAVLLQTVLLARLPVLDSGPALVLVTVIGIGMASGPSSGAIAGFGAGMALDILPPATGLMGSTALALVLAGVAAGRVRDPRGMAPAQRAAIVAGFALGVAVLMLALQWALTGAGVAVLSALTSTIQFVLVSAVLGLGVVPAVAAMLRRVSGSGQRRARAAVLR